LRVRRKINLDDNHINYIQYHYLYIRSYFKDVAIPGSSKEAFDYFLGQAKKVLAEHKHVHARHDVSGAASL
jgi:hypothetical protein